MDVTSIASAATALSQQKLANDVQMSVFKKVLDMSTQESQALIAAIPRPGSNPPNLGGGVDTYA